MHERKKINFTKMISRAPRKKLVTPEYVIAEMYEKLKFMVERQRMFMQERMSTMFNFSDGKNQFDCVAARKLCESLKPLIKQPEKKDQGLTHQEFMQVLHQSELSSLESKEPAQELMAELLRCLQDENFIAFLDPGTATFDFINTLFTFFPEYWSKLPEKFKDKLSAHLLEEKAVDLKSLDQVVISKPTELQDSFSLMILEEEKHDVLRNLRRIVAPPVKSLALEPLDAESKKTSVSELLLLPSHPDSISDETSDNYAEILNDVVNGVKLKRYAPEEQQSILIKMLELIHLINVNESAFMSQFALDALLLISADVISLENAEMMATSILSNLQNNKMTSSSVAQYEKMLQILGNLFSSVGEEMRDKLQVVLNKVITDESLKLTEDNLDYGFFKLISRARESLAKLAVIPVPTSDDQKKYQDRRHSIIASLFDLLLQPNEQKVDDLEDEFYGYVENYGERALTFILPKLTSEERLRLAPLIRQAENHVLGEEIRMKFLEQIYLHEKTDYVRARVKDELDRTLTIFSSGPRGMVCSYVM